MARKTERLQGLAQVRALAHPLRLRMVEEFARAPATAKQVAERLGEPPTRLYHHVSVLERAGLIRLSGRRSKRGATEKYYEASTRRFLGGEEVASVLAGAGAQRDRTAVGAMVFDQARNELVHALATYGEENRPPLIAMRAVALMSASGAKRVQRELQELLTRFRESASAGEGRVRGTRRPAMQRYSLTIALIPAGEDPSAPASGGEPGSGGTSG